MNRYDVVMDTESLTEDLEDLAERVGAPRPAVPHSRSRKSDVLDLPSISNATRRKICRLTARDFCCLNYRMPEACRADDIESGPRVMCEWVTNAEAGSDDGLPQIRNILV